MRNNGGGGHGQPGATGGPDSIQDETKESAHVGTPDENYADNVAPQNQPQGDLVLRKLRDLLDKNQVTPEVEKELGMSKEELNQFVKRYEKTPQTNEPGPAREIEAKPGQAPGVDPNRTLPDLNPSATFNTQTLRERGAFVQDQVRGNNEGVRLEPPRALRSGYDAYLRSLSRTRSNAARKPAGASADKGLDGR